MSVKEQNNKLTPMQRQYQEIKSQHRDKILLFRLGDFYEMFDEDASVAASLLNIALTKRHDNPMCGFPHHAANQYIKKLIQAGKKVAICDQVEDPSVAVGIVKRQIVNIITPGTIIEENFMENHDNNFLCVVYGEARSFALALVDVSTGEFFVHVLEGSDAYHSLQDELSRYNPAEILYFQGLDSDSTLRDILLSYYFQPEALPSWYFSLNDRPQWITDIEADPGIWEHALLAPLILATLRYLEETKFTSLSNIARIEWVEKKSFMELDDFTIKNLELIRNMQDASRKYTLLDVMDETLTPMGSRLLKRYLLQPLFNREALYFRQNCVEQFFEDSILLQNVEEYLRSMSDIDRLSTRIALKKAYPRDLKALSRSLIEAASLKSILTKVPYLKEIAASYKDLQALSSLIDSAIQDDPANSFNGNVIARGYNQELDELRSLMTEGKDWILRLQERERHNTGINSLKIKYNKVFGYFIEISLANLSAVPDHYLRKQSLVNAERFTVPELSEYEAKINNATEKVEKLEQSLFEDLVQELAHSIREFQQIAAAVSQIDVFQCFARVARDHHFTRPLIDDSSDFIVKKGRHPVVEKYMGSHLFVPNDCHLDNEESRIHIITGPNMAGKSTYLRQNALIALLAQVGSYVPAQSVKMGMIDRIFTRIGASDQLSAGRSTFLVEMEEAANILSHCSPQSLIIMDELGRGTSTYDGLSIAWAVIEHLHEKQERGARTLFATHYHELTQLAAKKGIQNFNIAVKEYEQELIFLRKVVEGPADKSYGIYVARLAGIDQEIVDRATVILNSLEKEGRRAGYEIEQVMDDKYRKAGEKAAHLELFSDNPQANVVEKIKNLDIDRITPLEAITFLAEVKKDLGNSSTQ